MTTPILALGLTDDRWGTRRATRSLLKRYPDAPLEERWLSPADGGAAIGHLGFFRSRFSADAVAAVYRPGCWRERR